MVDVDTFLTTLYVMVDDVYKSQLPIEKHSGRCELTDWSYLYTTSSPSIIIRLDAFQLLLWRSEVVTVQHADVVSLPTPMIPLRSSIRVSHATMLQAASSVPQAEALPPTCALKHKPRPRRWGFYLS